MSRRVVVAVLRAADSDGANRDLRMTTVTATVVRALVDVEPWDGGPRQVIPDGTIASDLARVGRVVTFTGRTVDDVEVAAGLDRGSVELRPSGGRAPYVSSGPTLSWRPDL